MRTSRATLRPKWFRKYHSRCQFGPKALTAPQFVCSHWDGRRARTAPVCPRTGWCIKAVTPYPQGDVTLEETKELGDEVFLLDGIPAIYFDRTFSVETLAECTQRIIDLFAPKLVLGISDEISSTGDLERIRVVGEIVDAYNAQFPD